MIDTIVPFSKNNLPTDEKARSKKIVIRSAFYFKNRLTLIIKIVISAYFSPLNSTKILACVLSVVNASNPLATISSKTILEVTIP